MNTSTCRTAPSLAQVRRALQIASLFIVAFIPSVIRAQIQPPPAKTFADIGNWWAAGTYNVIKVTNLNTDTSAGSWRWALAEAAALPAGENKIILFEVGGLIDFSNNTDLAQGRIRIADLYNTYIAGESAPSPGITIMGASHSFRRTNRLLFRHIRFRLGLPLALKGSGEYGNSSLSAYGDALSIEGPRNNNGTDRDTDLSNDIANDGLAFENCEFSWGLDETIQIWYQPNRNLTFLRCMFYDGFRYAAYGWRHPDTTPGGDDPSGHAMGMILSNGAHDETGAVNDVTGGNKRIDIQYSIFGNFQQRAPWLSKGNGVLLNSNLIFHGTHYGITSVGTNTTDHNSFLNIVDNLGMRTNNIVGGQLYFGYWWLSPGPDSMIYTDGNVGMESPATSPNKIADLGPRTTGWFPRGTIVVPDALFENSLITQSTPTGFTRWTGVTADQRFDYLKASAGARPNDLVAGARVDSVSQAFLVEVANKVGTYKSGPPVGYSPSTTSRAISDSAWDTATALQNSVARWRSEVELPEIISVNLCASISDATLAADEVAGAVPAANWVNATSTNQSPANVKDNRGTTTTADVVFTNTNSGYTLALTGTSPDVKLMRSQRGKSNATSMWVTVDQVPYATYDLYVYWAGRVATEAVPSTMAVNLQLWDGSAWVTNQSKYINDSDHLWDGTYNESLATSAGSAIDGEEYVAFRGVTATSVRVRVSAGNNAGITGFQIVQR